MKILHVLSYKKHPSYPTGDFVISQIRSLEKQGIENYIFEAGLFTISNFISNIYKLKKMINFIQPDIIHVHYSLNGIITIPQINLPIVVSFMGSDLNIINVQIKRIIVPIVSQIISLITDYNIVKSNSLKEKLKFKKARIKTIILPNGVDLKIFHPKDYNMSRKKVHFNMNDTIVIFVGNPIDSNKNFILARKVINYTNRRYNKNIKLIVISGKKRSEMPYYYSAADCLIVTSKFEGSPNSVKEGLACGIPIISVDVGDVKLQIKNVHNCYICKPNEISLGDSLIKVLNDGSRINNKQVIKRIDERQVTARLITIYRKLLKKS